MNHDLRGTSTDRVILLILCDGLFSTLSAMPMFARQYSRRMSDLQGGFITLRFLRLNIQGRICFK